MKKSTRLLALLLAVVTLVSTAVACNGDTPADTIGSTAVSTTDSAAVDTTKPTDTTAPIVDDTTNPSDTTESNVDDTTAPDTSDDTTAPTQKPEDLFDTPETVTIKKKGATLNYKITRPQTAASNSPEMGMAQEISALLSEKLGVTATLDTDKRKEEDSEDLEIIVGATDHPETVALFPETTYGNYILRAVGNKIIIISFSELGYTRALNHLEKILNRGHNEKNNKITVNTADIAKSEIVSKQLNALPTYEWGKYYAMFDAGRVTAATECDEIIVKSTNFLEYDKYLEKLTASGYTQYSSSVIGNNKFAIYTNGEYTVNVGYYDYDKSARLLIEPKGALPTRKEDNNTERVTDSQITMVAVSKGDSVNGLSTLIRLEDGRFIVVDGAWAEGFNHLVETMKAQSLKYSDGKPVVAAWIVTHGHGDHVGLLINKYIELKKSGVTVESIILNEIAEKFVPNIGYGNGTTDKVLSAVAPTLGADVYKAHIGQSFYISNCRIDIVYSQEGVAPGGCNSYNATSVVTKMTFTDSKTGKVTTYLSTGDATGIAMQTATNIFGNYMQCDIISLPHHGGNPNGETGQLEAAYRFVKPQLILCPVGNRDIKHINGRSYNKVLLGGQNFKQIFYAGDRGGSDVVVPLPYSVGNVIRVPH